MEFLITPSSFAAQDNGEKQAATSLTDENPEPELLRSIKLRKHIATVSQVANLKDNELDMLAKFMGHDVRIHRKFYRLPDETLQVARVSKLLMACSGGGNIAGKNLEEIDVTPDEGNTFKVASISY